MFKKILIANRGEIALRIIRACKEMGIKTVAVHSTCDAGAMHVRLADESVCIGPAAPAKSYLSKIAIISAAMVTQAEAIHPGYGFLSENADFVQMVEEHSIAFIGPSSKHIRLMGDKITAKNTAKEAGLPIIPGSDTEIQSDAQALKLADKIGYPLLIKATAGGGGKGIKPVGQKADLIEAIAMARKEAAAAFGSDSVYMEKLFSRPRHIEVQVLADKYGNVVCLGERDCSLQRNRQKIIEETPSPALTPKQRVQICEIVAKAMKRVGYVNAGTVEFLFEDGKFYFMEMNTRLQVEHPITEEVYDLDLVKEQIRIAAGEKLTLRQKYIEPRGHAIEFRINAEDPYTFIPHPGLVKTYHAPGGIGVRVDSELYANYQVPSFYDSMVGKLIVHGANREEAIARGRRALAEFVIDGISTTIPLYQQLLQSTEFRSGDYNIYWLQKFLAAAVSKS